MSQLITPPDYVDEDYQSILMVDASPDTIEMVISACRILNNDYNIYLCGKDADPMWISSVISRCEKVFINSGFEEVINYLKEQDAR